MTALVVFGLLIAAVAVVAAIGVLIDNDTISVSLTAFGKTFTDLSLAEVFLAGAVVAVVFVLGWVLFIAGIRRARNLRRELLDLREDREGYVESLAAEKAKLERELARTRKPDATTGVRVASQSLRRDDGPAFP